MRRHRKKPRISSEVELNLAAMLDMAFQLLAFFILTFRPAPVEGDIMLRMPPPMPTTIVQGGERPGADQLNTNPLQGLNTLLITVLGTESGTIKAMAVGDPTTGTVPTLAALDARLKSVLADVSAFEQVTIQVGSSLHYSELMQVIDVCTRQRLANGKKLSKLNMVELPGG
jgi:biopolymer transport protein ExbD